MRKRGRVSLSRVLFDKWLADRKCDARFRGQSVSSILSVELPQEDFDSKSWYNNKGVKNLWKKSEMCRWFKRIAFEYFLLFLVRVPLSWMWAVSTNLVYSGERGAGLNLTVKVDFGNSSFVKKNEDNEEKWKKSYFEIPPTCPLENRRIPWNRI